MDTKLLSALLFIVGTSIGAGMLALPVATASLGFWGSLVLLFACWFLMTTGALYVLEANLWVPLNSNLISMARITLGPVGQVIAWISYCFLLYSLLSAYISAGSDLLQYLMSFTGVALSHPAAAIIFTLLFGFIVFAGIKIVDYANRGFMFAKCITYILLMVVLMPFVELIHLDAGHFDKLTQTEAIMVTITSFGFAIIIPSLRVFFESDKLRLRKAVLIGSLIPLVCYVLWDIVIMGVLPLTGENGLLHVAASQGSTSSLVHSLSLYASTQSVWYLTKIFTSICVITSFLGVALCMMDFMADACSFEKIGWQRWLLALMTFLPPVLLVIFWPNIFIKALSFAGVDCVILLMLLPALMVYSGRYRKKLSSVYHVYGGKSLLILLIAFSALMIIGAFL